MIVITPSSILQEARFSEEYVTRYAKYFPEEYFEEALHILQKSTYLDAQSECFLTRCDTDQHATKDVIDKIYGYFRHNAVVGEKAKGVWDYSTTEEGGEGEASSASKSYIGGLTIVAVCPLTSPHDERTYVVRWDPLPDEIAASATTVPPTIIPHSVLRYLFSLSLFLLFLSCGMYRDRPQFPRKAVKHFIR